MSTLHNIRLAIIAASLLLPLAEGCGEIELPTREEPSTTERPETPNNDKGDEGQTDKEDNEPEEKPDNENQENNNDDTNDDGSNNNKDDNTTPDDNKDDNTTPGIKDEDTPPDDTPSGKAILTEDGHILVDNLLYLSVIEFVNIKGSNATNAKDIAKEYVEGSLAGWRVPTHDDAVILTSVLTSKTQWYGGSPMAVLNHAMEDTDAEYYFPLSLYEGSGDNPSPIYYLSDEGTTAYTYAAGASQPFTNVKASKKYRLRLVKDK